MPKMKMKTLKSIVKVGQSLLRRFVILGYATTLLSIGADSPTNVNQPVSKCIVLVDDISSPPELKQHGIEAADPETLARLFDVIAEKNISCHLVYLPIRERADRTVPVIVQLPSFNEKAPASPERGLQLPELQKAWKTYREQKAAYDERLQNFQTQRDETREKFVRGALDALAAAEAEVSALRQTKRNYRASDVEGAILTAVSTLRAMTGAGILILNSDMNDAVTHRRPRSTPFTDAELPRDVIGGIVMVNTSFKPDASPLISKTSAAKYHASSLKSAAELVVTLIPVMAETKP